MTRDMVQILKGNIDAIGGMELLMQQKQDLEAAGYQDNQMCLLPGMLILKLEDGEVRWMAFEGIFKMEIWKD